MSDSNIFQDPQVVAASIGATANLLGGLVNNSTSKSAQQRTHKYNLELQENAHEMALQQMNESARLQNESWQMQAEYLSPENQIQRYKDAGLNPLFNSEATAPSISAAAPSGAAPAPSSSYVPTDNFSGLGTDAVNMYTALADNQRKDERHVVEINKVSVETDKLISEIVNLDVDSEVGRAKINEINANIEKIYADTEATYEKTHLAAKKYLADLFYKEWELGLKERQVDTQEALTESQIELQDAQEYQAYAGGQAALMTASAAEQQAETLNSRLIHDQNEAQRRYDLDVDKFKQDIENNRFDRIQKILENATGSIFGVKYYKSSEVVGIYQAFSEFLKEGSVGGIDQLDNFGTEFNRIKLFRKAGDAVKNMQQQKVYNHGRY